MAELLNLGLFKLCFSIWAMMWWQRVKPRPPEILILPTFHCPLPLLPSPTSSFCLHQYKKGSYPESLQAVPTFNNASL